MAFQLGLKPPVPGAVKLRLATYLDFKTLPTPPDHFGHANLVPAWGMLGNGSAPDNPPGLPDGAGDCAPAGACHMTMLWTAEAGDMAPFTCAAALQNYSAITGFTQTDPATGKPYGPDDNPTDTGCTVDDIAKYWRQTGFVDANSKRHQIVAYADTNPGDVRELWLASWLFQCCGMGFDLPYSALQQARDNQIWDVTSDTSIAGGHFVPCVARPAASMGVGISWGKPHPFTARFYQKYNSQGMVAFSREMLIKAKSIDGVDDATLLDDVKEVTRV
jgi:hypothetical protein